MNKWRITLIKRIEELARLSGLSTATISHRIGRDGEIYNRLKNGGGMDADKAEELAKMLLVEIRKYGGRKK